MRVEPKFGAKCLAQFEAVAWPPIDIRSPINAIDWDEFWAVVNGNGPCNKERLATRVKAWNDGAWVREAALAHTRKQQERALKEAA